MTVDEGAASRLAEVLLGSCLRLRRGENLIVETWNHTLPYAAALVTEARRRGVRPMLLLEDEAAYWRSVDLGPAVPAWSQVGAPEWAALARAQGYVFFPGPADRPRFRSLPAPTRSRLVGYNDEWYRRARAARLRGVRSVLGYASDAQAARWGVAAGAWRDSLLRGSVEANYAQIRADARRIAQKLKAGKELRITGPNGTDLKLKLRGRRATADDGVIGPEDLSAGENMTTSPPGTVAVAVDERSAEGLVVANRPSFQPDGRLEGGQWEVKGGRLVNFWYTDNQSTFESAYSAAPKNKDVLGYFSIGLNGALGPGVPQVEDQEAGSVTLGIGGNVNVGGSNRCPFFSWVVLGEATVAVDGRPLSDRGKLF